MNATGVNNWPKLVFAIVAIVCISILMATGSIDGAAGMPAITLVIGYVLGNGIAAKKGDPVEPIIGQRVTPLE